MTANTKQQTKKNPLLLRKLGPNEHYSSTRQHLNLYRAVAVTCRYQYPPTTPPSASEDISPLFYAAVARLIKAQPMLRVGITGQDTFAAHFTHITEVDLRNHIDLITISCDTVQEYEDRVAEEHGLHNDTVFLQGVDTCPPWRVTILRPVGNVLQHLRHQEDVIFTFHHSLMDGTSGRRFHEMLLSVIIQESEQTPPPTEPVYIFPFPEPPIMPEIQEDVVKFKFSLGFAGRVLWSEFGPPLFASKKLPIWYGKEIDFSIPYKTNVRPVDISPETVASLVKACRSNSTTLTGLIQAMVLASMATRIPADQAKAFTATTPINLRPFVSSAINPSTKDSLRGLITTFEHSFNLSAISPFREPEADITVLIWENAKRIKDELNNRTATLPKDDMTGMLKYIGDWTSFWNKKNGQPRTHSWEVSNIGVIKNPEGEDHPRITRVLFTNPSMVTGAAVGLGVGSSTGGRLTMGVSWQDTIVSEEFVDTLIKDIYSYVSQFEETGRFT